MFEEVVTFTTEFSVIIVAWVSLHFISDIHQSVFTVILLIRERTSALYYKGTDEQLRDNHISSGSYAAVLNADKKNDHHYLRWKNKRVVEGLACHNLPPRTMCVRHDKRSPRPGTKHSRHRYRSSPAPCIVSPGDHDVRLSYNMKTMTAASTTYCCSFHKM